MGHSASIAKKYSPSKDSPSKRGTEAQTDYDEDQELASVSSYRPTSPVAHSDARSFVLDTPRKQRRERGRYSDRSSHHSNRVDLVPYGSREPSYATVNGTIPSYASSSQSSHFRSMKEVRDYINSNPDLLVKKKHVKSHKDKLGGFDDIITQHKQMKTKQRVYLSLISPPIIYAMGARPDDRQLRVNQNVYLNLVYPTQDRRLYQEQAHKWRSPLRHNDMVVVRKNGQIKQPLSKVHAPRTYSQQMVLPQLSRKSKAGSSQSMERTLALTTAPPRSRQPLPPPAKARQKAGNDYFMPPVTSTKKRPQKVQSQSLNVQPASQRSWSGKEHSAVPVQKSMTRQRSNASDATVEFTFNVEDLNLKKKSEVADFEQDKDKGKVVPLYFRKSLAYSPKYIEDDGLLSSPL